MSDKVHTPQDDVNTYSEHGNGGVAQPTVEIGVPL
jgi:hypothetical protein